MELPGEATGVARDALGTEAHRRTQSLRIQLGFQAPPEGKKQGLGPWKFLRRAES